MAEVEYIIGDNKRVRILGSVPQIGSVVNLYMGDLHKRFLVKSVTHHITVGADLLEVVEVDVKDLDKI